jgi:serine/threonine protein kinase
MDVETTKLQALFEAALEIPDAAHREIFLDQSCAGDAQLREQIGQLLHAHAKADRLFSRGVTDFVSSTVDSLTASALASGAPTGAEAIGSRVGRYKILQLLGEGGCGLVYLAEQEEPVRRRVALKILKLGMDTKSVIARFEAERQALALMDHPYIAKVLDAGATESGRPYFVMELVGGIRITKYCDDNRLDTQQRLKLFLQICHAIQHAHQKGVVHRDIKPSNILVTVNNDVPMPKVIDFGIAKATDGNLTDNPAFTVMGQFIGTPAYMSPEQAELGGLDVDTRSDIYSLGIVLYELLTGRTPLDQNELVRSSFEKIRRTLQEHEPQRPSTLLAAVGPTELALIAERRRTEPFKLLKSIRGDLDWIVMKALEKDRARRYETANSLAVDIQRHLDLEPVAARPPSQVYRLRRLVRRNKVVFVSGTIVVLTMAVGLALSTWLFLREREALRVQDRLRRDAEIARANEMLLRQKAEAREKVTEAGVLASHNKMQEADDLLEQVPAELFSPSLEATTIFRNLGTWNILRGRWKKAADRFSVLVQVNQVDKSDRTDRATSDLLLAAPLLIQAENLSGYNQMRRMELTRLSGTSNLIAAEQLLKTSLLAPADPTFMALLEPLAKLLTDSLASKDPAINDASFYAAWRSFALALREYRLGNFAAAENWLERCARYPSQAPSCVANTHILLGMARLHLGKTQAADTELKLGRKLVEDLFAKKLELSDSKSGLLAGWLTARILLREADELVESQNNETE